MDSWKVRFPQYLNAPFQVLWFEVDELSIFFGFFIISMLFDSLWPYLAMILVPYLFGKVKRRYARGFLKHMLYRIGLLEFEGYPGAFVKRFRE